MAIYAIAVNPNLEASLNEVTSAVFAKTKMAIIKMLEARLRGTGRGQSF